MKPGGFHGRKRGDSSSSEFAFTGRSKAKADCLDAIASGFSGRRARILEFSLALIISLSAVAWVTPISASTSATLTQFYSGSYVGNGATTSRVIPVPFVPSYIYIYQSAGTGLQFAEVVGNTTVQSLFYSTGAGSYSGDRETSFITSAGFDVGAMQSLDSVANNNLKDYAFIAMGGGGSQVSGICPTGQSVVSVNSNGTVTCAANNGGGPSSCSPVLGYVCSASTTVVTASSSTTSSPPPPPQLGTYELPTAVFLLVVIISVVFAYGLIRSRSEPRRLMGSVQGPDLGALRKKVRRTFG